MKIFLLSIVVLLICNTAFAQSDVDTLHYRKVYYFGGTGMAFPIGTTNDVLSAKFSGSIGLDISLKDPKYFLQPALYTLSFGYNQKLLEDGYSHKLENATASFYTLSLAGGIRKQMKRLNTYAFVGPGFGFVSEPRASVLPSSVVKIDNEKRFAFSSKLGLGADYKFNGFFLGLEVGYLHSFRKIQDTPINILTVMVGLKSDITGLSDKVVKVIGVDGLINGKE